jgi:hypothetical protein
MQTRWKSGADVAKLENLRRMQGIALALLLTMVALLAATLPTRPIHRRVVISIPNAGMRRPSAERSRRYRKRLPPTTFVSCHRAAELSLRGQMERHSNDRFRAIWTEALNGCNWPRPASSSTVPDRPEAVGPGARKRSLKPVGAAAQIAAKARVNLLSATRKTALGMCQPRHRGGVEKAARLREPRTIKYVSISI